MTGPAMAAAIAAVIGLVSLLVVPRIRRGDFGYRDVFLFGIAFTLPLRNVTLLHVLGGHVRLGDMFLLTAAAMLALELALVPRRPRLTAVDVLLILFVVWCFCTLTWSLDPAFGVTRALKYLRDLLLFGVVAAWSRGRFAPAFRALSTGVLGSFAYVIPLAALRAFDRLSWLQEKQSSKGLELFRSQGGIGSVTYAPEATILEVGYWTLIGIWFLLGRAGWIAPTPVRRALFWSAMILLGTLEMATFARGAWMALALAGVCWLALIESGARRRFFGGAAIVLVALSLVAFGLGMQRQLMTRVGVNGVVDEDKSISKRVKHWQLAVDAIEQYPMGVGIGGSTVAIQRKGEYWFVHNLYLQLFAELGPIGFSLAVGALSLAMMRAMRAARTAHARFVHFAAAALGGAILSYLVMGLVYHDFADLEIWTLLAIATALPGRGDA